MDEDDVPSWDATPEEEVEFWRTHDINGKRLPPRKPVEFKRPEPDLRVTPLEPHRDPLAHRPSRPILSANPLSR
jgi:hypothetical protein